MRIMARTLLAVLVVGGALALSGPALAHGHNCSDYSTSAEATSAMGAGDPDNLDADDDGIACESLPAGASSSGDGSMSGSDDDMSGVPSGGVDAGMGGTASDGTAVPVTLTLAGSGLLVIGLLLMRRRPTQ
jgi:hypothetical protein